MSASDDKKLKRKKNKRSSVAKSKSQNLTQATCQNIPSPVDLTVPSTRDLLSSSIDSETLKKLEKLMDAKDDPELPQILSLSRGPNPYLDKERCLLCGCERLDPPEAAVLKSQSSEKKTELNSLAQLPLWVCPDCRKSTDQEMEKKVNLASLMEQDLPPEPATLPFLSDTNFGIGEPTMPNGSVCNCEACTERREIEAEHDRETQELQTCWTVLRNLIRKLYSEREDCGVSSSTDTSPEHKHDSNDCDDTQLPDEEQAKELVHRLCSRDPHQLFLRLESQVREFVIEMKVRLLKQLHSGYKTPPEAKTFISMLLEEYGHLCHVSRKMAEVLTELKTDHLAKFNVTWELHNKHLFQSIAYTEPSLQSSLHLIITQLRLGAASKESYNEDTYPNLLHRYLKFDDEMSVISVVWRDSHQLIEQYNEEQAALKLKQKMLKEDWEFFKAQRKILEQQVAKNTKTPLSHSNTNSFEAQFTETMRLMLQGTKPAPEECHCSRCNRKRCPCDECTITHMITCGIINPEALEATDNTNHVNFLHDPNRYRIDVSPPSMSSTTSSSGSSSPVMVEPVPFPDLEEHFISGEDIPEEIEGISQSGDVDEDNVDDDDDDDGEDEEYDEDDDDDDDDEDCEDDEEDEDCEEDDDEEEKMEEDLDIDNIKMDHESVNLSPPTWLTDSDDGAADLISSETCDCYHCVSQAQAEQIVKSEESLCQCYVCLRQRGKTVSTSLPTQMPSVQTRPGEFHLYPHIHGSTGLPHGLSSRSHIRPVLQPQLYDLHLPMRQPKPIIQPKVPLKLDFDSPDGIHEHIYHAYGEWDNTYDTRGLLPKYELGSELLPPPPLTSNFTTSFLSEPYTMATLMGVDTVSTSTSSTSAFKTSMSNSHIPAPAQVFLDSTSAKIQMSTSKDFNSTPMLPTMTSKTMSPPCTRPATLGGNNNQSVLQPPLSSIPQSQPPMQPRPPGPVLDKPHSQHCKRHNILGKALTSSQSHNHTSATTTSSTNKVSQDFIQTAARNIREGAKEGMQMIRQFASSLNANVNTHTCNHTSSRNNIGGHTHAANCTMDHNHVTACQNSISMPTSVNNVSVGTSTVCIEPDCDVHFDDACDSVSDSCSEQSSTTSSSNQKEGKYCDCCYCEFFGHGNPPVAPTSKNYAEMRDRLRLRLKKKNEAKQDCHKDTCANKREIPKLEPDACTSFVTNHEDDSKDPMELKGLDELIRFINGTEEQKLGADKSMTAKAAKRARQKQRKNEEKARIEAERKHQEQQRLLQEEQERLKKNKLNAAKLEQEKSQKKKKKKHKVVPEDTNPACSEDGNINLNLIRIPPAGREDEQHSGSKQIDSKSKGCELREQNPSSQSNGKISEESSAGTKPIKGRTKSPRTSEKQPIQVQVCTAKVDKKSVKNSSQTSQTSKAYPIISKPVSSKNSVPQTSSASRQQPNGNITSTTSSSRTSQGKEITKNFHDSQLHNGTCVQIKLEDLQQNGTNRKGRKQTGSLNSSGPSVQPLNIQHHSNTHQVITKQSGQPLTQHHSNTHQVITKQSGQPLTQHHSNTHQVITKQSGQPLTQHHSNTHQVITKLSGQPVNSQNQSHSQQPTTKQSGQPVNTQSQSHSQQPTTKLLGQPLNSQNQSHSQQSTIKQSGIRQGPPQDLHRKATGQQQAMTPPKGHLQNGVIISPANRRVVSADSSQNHQSHPNSIVGKQPTSNDKKPGKPASPVERLEETSPNNEQNKNSSGKNKRNKKKNRGSEDLSMIDEIFMPKSESDLEGGDMDEVEKELEEFKRFCLGSTPVKREKLQVNMNLKDIFVKKKSGLGCT
ncbi:protein FAM193A-like [Pecten maximus]|uniref:protein FAM193A-like n=1 Tax=Pecten maximus TaxID=6579 RepID=UPI001458ADED|nr:protein FAM193A-like [Pecten maximus]